jgi:hypothetical protein
MPVRGVPRFETFQPRYKTFSSAAPLNDRLAPQVISSMLLPVLRPDGGGGDDGNSALPAPVCSRRPTDTCCRRRWRAVD